MYKEQTNQVQNAAIYALSEYIFTKASVTYEDMLEDLNRLPFTFPRPGQPLAEDFKQWGDHSAKAVRACLMVNEDHFGEVRQVTIR